MSDNGTYQPMMREIPASERPRERLHLYGEQSLSVGELLAIILRSGTEGESALALANRLLAENKGLGGLARLSPAQLMQIRGFGEAKVAEFRAVFELARRMALEEAEVKPVIRSPQEIQNYVGPTMGYLDHEEVRVLLLNTRNQLLANKLIYRGTVSSAHIRVAEAFKDAIQYNAPSIILVHNHPSGDPTPSPDDIRVTRQIVEAGSTLDVELLDHVVVTDRLFVSMRAQGLGF